MTDAVKLEGEGMKDNSSTAGAVPIAPDQPSPTAARFRMRPVVKEARQFDGLNWPALHEWTDSRVWIWDAVDQIIAVATLEGVVRANKGDWIVKGIAGEFYPVRADIFAATYEAVAEDAGQEPASYAGTPNRAGLEAVRREALEEAAKMVEGFTAYTGYGREYGENYTAIFARGNLSAKTAIATLLRALAANPQEGAAEGEGQDDGALRREKIAPPPRGGSVIGEDTQ